MLSRGGGIEVTCRDIVAPSYAGGAHWTAGYTFTMFVKTIRDRACQALDEFQLS
ncbi:hypothetical protein AB0B45_33275 [Nonomuraea sp. NPDC049152]|uniref:hypothetical protein n=1 Tax=Nonomuraea sp. NPDC049152 TaxID=3154350 RepID=UPI0033F947D0